MSDIKMFHNPGQALAYMTECAFATLEMVKTSNRSSQTSIRRAENIAETGFANCKLFVTLNDAHMARCPRVERKLRDYFEEVARSEEKGA